MQNRLLYGYIFLILCSLIRCTDVASVLEDKNQSTVLWKGKWKSAEYLLVFGSVAVKLPKILEINKEICAPIAISFSPMNVYRPGRTYVAQYRGKLKSTLPDLNINSFREIRCPTSFSHLGLTFFDGEHDFAEAVYIQFNRELTEATGYWRSIDGDYGKFTLQKVEQI